ncbi:dihydrolipoamide acetyltransferase family protein [Halovulum sp. GXIMD14794]
MPSLGADMEAGKLVEWLVAPGDAVKRGDVVAVVETQKGAIEIEVFEDGIIERIDAALGEMLKVGAPLAVIRQPGETAGSKPERPATDAVPAPAPQSTPTEPLHFEVPEGIAASPAARARAAELGLDLSTVSGSGPDGAVVLADVDGTGIRKSRGKPGLDLDAMRLAIAAAMTRSKHEIPHYYLEHEIDLTLAETWLGDRNGARPPAERILMGALLVKAVVDAARSVPGLNGHYLNEAFSSSATVNAGVAVALRGGGLIAPAILGAEALSLGQVMEEMRDLVGRARSGRLKNSEMTQGTITISSLGERGVDGMTGVIYPPQVALVAFGTPRQSPRVVSGEVMPRQCVHVTLAADHRVSDGRRGAKFLTELDRRLQEPEAL